MPQLSVILPVYNGREFLAQAIESVLGGEFADLELIIVDDGSDDGSGAIADEYAGRDSRVRVLHTDNGGLSVARNRGVEVADAPWVSFIDADDALHPRGLSLLLKLAADNSDADVIVGGFTTNPGFAEKPMKGRVRNMPPQALIAETLYQRGAVHAAWGKLYRLDLLRIEPFTPGLYYEDLDFFYRYCLRCREAVVTDAAVYFYRQQPASIMHTWSPRRLHVLDVTKRIEQEVESRCPDLLPAARDRRLSANFNISILASAAGCDDISHECWRVVRLYRRHSLFDRRVRFKNKAGILLSYLGRKSFLRISRWAGM